MGQFPCLTRVIHGDDGIAHLQDGPVMPNHEGNQGTKVAGGRHTLAALAAHSIAPSQNSWTELFHQDRQVGLCFGEAELGVGAGRAHEVEYLMQPEAILLGKHEEAQLHSLDTVGVA